MTESEKQEILSELEERFDKKYKISEKKNTTYIILEKPRKKWFRNKCGQTTLMQSAFKNAYISNMAWGAIRKLTCCICGKLYVKDLEDVKESEEIAEEICQFVYDLCMKYKESSYD